MEYADLKSQRKNNTAWRMLTSAHAPLIASFLYQVFIKVNKCSLPFDVVVSKLDDMLYHLNQLEGENLSEARLELSGSLRRACIMMKSALT